MPTLARKALLAKCPRSRPHDPSRLPSEQVELTRRKETSTQSFMCSPRSAKRGLGSGSDAGQIAHAQTRKVFRSGGSISSRWRAGAVLCAAPTPRAGPLLRLWPSLAWGFLGLGHRRQVDASGKARAHPRLVGGFDLRALADVLQRRPPPFGLDLGAVGHLEGLTPEPQGPRGDLERSRFRVDLLDRALDRGPCWCSWRTLHTRHGLLGLHPPGTDGHREQDGNRHQEP